MYIELGIPAALPLGILNLERRPCLLGVALKHPPVHLRAQANTTSKVSGPRADVAAAYLEQLYKNRRYANHVEIEIELAIPALMGLSSETMTGLGMAKAISYFNMPAGNDIDALTNGIDFSTEQGLQIWGAAKGGLLLVDAQQSDLLPEPIKRAELDDSEKNAWAFVLVLPRPSADTIATLEADRLANLLAAAGQMGDEGGQLWTDVLAPAVAQDDLAAFGAGLMQLQTLNQQALAEQGTPISLTDQEQGILKIMQESGAVAWGQSPTGLGLYALTRGARATINMRVALRQAVDFYGGHMIATIANNQGISVLEKEGALDKWKDIQRAR